MSINKVVLSGRLTKDPEIRHTQGGTCVAHYTVAVNRRKKEDDGTVKADFISCVVMGKGAEHAEKYYRKGMKIDLSGRIQTGSYTNRDGVKVYTTDVFVEEQDFGESKAASGSAPAKQAAPAPAYNQQAPGNYQQAPAQAPTQETTAQEWESYFGAAFGEELPFT